MKTVTVDEMVTHIQEYDGAVYTIDSKEALSGIKQVRYVNTNNDVLAMKIITDKEIIYQIKEYDYEIQDA